MTRCVAIVAAIAVLWHTTSGCCAHHGHAEPVAGHFGAVVSFQCQHDDDSCHAAQHECPGSPESSQCQESTCAFAVPDAPISVEFDALGNGFFLSDFVLNDQTYGGSFASSDHLASTAPFLLGALSRHLALGVLLL